MYMIMKLPVGTSICIVILMLAYISWELYSTEWVRPDKKVTLEISITMIKHFRIPALTVWKGVLLASSGYNGMGLDKRDKEPFYTDPSPHSAGQSFKMCGDRYAWLWRYLIINSSQLLRTFD